mmetsp:Transcript_4795/g.10078  ORF Transcript_4795/g.10078 Transcript_4795/m.10078 type:complete len:83 (+) Transcript_4795:545-793(+)
MTQMVTPVLIWVSKTTKKEVEWRQLQKKLLMGSFLYTTSSQTRKLPLCDSEFGSLSKVKASKKFKQYSYFLTKHDHIPEYMQ